MPFKFSVGPWNVSSGADVYGPATRSEIPMEEKIRKFKELGFEPVPAKQVKSVAIAECALHLECKVIYVCEMRESKLDPIIARDMYINREYHTLYFGEIVRCSVDKK